jgi:phenylalanyl-tRNA synthetase beta chain
MRAPLSWLRDFAPFGDDAAALAETLTDLGLVVEEVEHVGEGLSDVVVARVEEITAIAGADRIRRVVVDAGDGPLEIVCGAWNFAVGDLLPLAPVGAVLPGDFAITRRKMRGVTSNGMLCSGRELRLSDDSEGLLVLTDVAGAHPGQPLTEALGIEHDVVFDITVEGNRPDAWCIAGIARDLAGRLGLPFALPEPPDPGAGVAVGETVDGLASLAIEDLDLCPRMTVRVLTGVTVGPSPQIVQRRLTLAGMRPINNVVDASNYVMLELGQPTHPYDLDRLPGHGLLVRRAKAGETVETLDGVERTVGTPGRGLGHTGEDCLICDAEGTPVGLGGIMGGSSSEISEGTSRVLLETAYFTPMVIARTSRRLALRTEASARFERGCDPWGIERAAARFCELVQASDPRASVVPGLLDVRGEVPGPVELSVPLARVNGQLGLSLGADDVAALLRPLGFGCEVGGAGGGEIGVTAPTNRPDVREAPYGVDDVIEEVARVYGYGRLPRRQPSWPQPGGLTSLQRRRRLVRDVLCGLGASEAWTPSFVADRDHERIGLSGRAVEVTNPLAHEERWLRRALLPGLLRALAYNADRRQGLIRLYEVGVVFEHPDNGVARVVERAGAGGASSALLPAEREMVAGVFSGVGDDARTAVAAWHVLAEALGVTGVRVRSLDRLGAASGSSREAASALVGLHPTRSAVLVAGSGDGAADGTVIGAVGEVDPAVIADFGLSGRVGWLEFDLGLLVDPAVVARRAEESAPVSRYPSSDIDLAFVVDDAVPVDRVADVLSAAGGDLLESVQLFDVFRGASVGDGRRSLAFRLRFCALDRTLTDGEVGDLRASCIEAAAREVDAVLR